MKFFSVAAVLLSVAPLSNAYNHDAQRILILGGETVPSGTKTYMATPHRRRQHILRRSPHQSDPRADRFTLQCVSLFGSHYRNGTEDGERIKIVSMMNHPNYSDNVEYSNDFTVVELERPSKFQPVKLAVADDSDFKPGKMATTMGWGTTAEENGTAPYELQRVDVPFASDEACAAYAKVDASMVCAGGVANRDSCTGGSGGPLIVEDEKDGDVLVGLVSWAKDDTCGREGYFGVYSRVSRVQAWIETITGGKGTCLP